MARFPATAARHDVQTTVVPVLVTTDEADEARWFAVEVFAFVVFSLCCSASVGAGS